MDTRSLAVAREGIEGVRQSHERLSARAGRLNLDIACLEEQMQRVRANHRSDEAASIRQRLLELCDQLEHVLEERTKIEGGIIQLHQLLDRADRVQQGFDRYDAELRYLTDQEDCVYANINLAEIRLERIIQEVTTVLERLRLPTS